MSFFWRGSFAGRSGRTGVGVGTVAILLVISAILFIPLTRASSQENGGLEYVQEAIPADHARQQDKSSETRGSSNSPEEYKLVKARSFDGDVRSLSQPARTRRSQTIEPARSASVESMPPAPAPIITFDGLDRASWNGDIPPDTSGDAGPNHYIQAISSAVGIYNKSTGAQIAAFSFNTLMSQGNFGNLCDTNNMGNPNVLYDTFEDRWVITDFAYTVDGSNNIQNPPGAFQCIAVSKTGDPVSGGWNFYSINRTDGLPDSPKFGIWPDGLYMSANMVDFTNVRTYMGARVWAFNKAQMYAGTPNVQIISFFVGTGDFSLLPGNARLQTGTPPADTPNYFASSWNFLNAVTVYKFKVNWNQTPLSTFTGPDAPLAATSWPNANVPTVPTPSGNPLEPVQIRTMPQNQYTNIGGTESLWLTHTVRRANTTGFAAPRWYQVNVTGNTVAPNMPQAATWDPEGTNVIHRFVPSLAVDRAGNMAIGYSAGTATVNPEIRYAGRLASDAVNTFSQTEQTLFAGTASQLGSSRWGENSSMTIDPDGCTFWYTNQYYAAAGLDYRTRIGSFQMPGCTVIGNGSLEGTVTSGGNPVAGATVMLGSRTATTNGSGQYSFSGLPAGTYPVATASAPGFVSNSINSIVINEGPATTQNFVLVEAPQSACYTDTTQADFSSGELSGVNTTAGGDLVLANPLATDQQNQSLSTSGVGITVTTWGGQTFTPSVTGSLNKVDINLFCSGCTGTLPNLTVSLRATSGGLPTGADIASATITGFSSGASNFYTATFSTPPTVNAGTLYALVIRPVTNPSPGTYALTRSATDVYAGGQRVAGATSGTAWSVPLTSGASTDAGFVTYIDAGYQTAGTFVSAAIDANPATGTITDWGTISWNSTTPAGTAVSFQAAASNDPNGPFDFVGPDGTDTSYFANGASLSQFNGIRYLRYKAFLSTTDADVSPAIHDVTICFSNRQATTTTVAPAAGTAGGSVDLSATLTDSSGGVSGQTLDFTLNGSSAGSAVTDAAGTATLSGVNLGATSPGIYPGGVSVSYSGNTTHQASSGSATLTVYAYPTIAKAFAPSAILTGGASTVTLTLTNPAATGALTNASFTDDLTNMTAVGGAAGGTCAGASSNILTAGATNLSFSGITIPDNASCTVTFAVTSSTAGTHANETSGVTTTQTPVAGPGSNSASLTVTNTATWTGASSSDWHSAANWSPAVPTAAHSALLPSGVLPNEPSILPAGSNASAASLEIQTGRTLTIGNDRILSVTGALTNNGTINNAGSFTFGTFSGTGVVNFNGTTAQTVPAGSYTSLTMNNPGGATLGGDVTITSVLTLTSGNITTGANTLIIDQGGSISRTGGHVIGNLRKVFSTPPPPAVGPEAAPAAIFVYPVGTANGYSPVTINAAGAGSFTVSATQSFMAGANPAQSIQRYWTLTPSGITSADITFQYLDADVPGGATEAGFRFLRKVGSAYGSFAPSSFDTAANTFTLNGVTAFSEWSLGNLTVTSAPVPVSGQVRNENGQGVGKASVTITGPNGMKYQVMTNPFGYYSFENIPAGDSYFVSVEHKQYRFTPRVLSISDAVNNLDFVPSP